MSRNNPWSDLRRPADSGGVPHRPAAKASVEFSDQIQIEDVGICEAVQKNLRSRSYSRGRFSVKQEKGVHAFHRMYAEMMAKD